MQIFFILHVYMDIKVCLAFMFPAEVQSDM